MIAIQEETNIILFKEVPKTYDIWNNFNDSPEQMIYAYGFREVVYPSIPEGKKQGSIYFDDANDVFTYEVLDKTIQDYENEFNNVKAKEDIQSLFSDNTGLIPFYAPLMDNLAVPLLPKNFKNLNDFSFKYKKAGIINETELNEFRGIFSAQNITLTDY